MRNLYEELFGFRREFDEMFNRLLAERPFAGFPELAPVKKELKEFNFTPAVETFIDKQANKYVCRVTLPGVEPKEVEVRTEGNLLIIRGERKFHHAVKEVAFMEREVAYGTFERMFALPEGVLTEKLAAEFVNGVLEITAPVAAAALPRKIEVKTTTPIVKQVAA